MGHADRAHEWLLIRVNRRLSAQRQTVAIDPKRTSHASGSCKPAPVFSRTGQSISRSCAPFSATLLREASPGDFHRARLFIGRFQMPDLNSLVWLRAWKSQFLKIAIFIACCLGRSLRVVPAGCSGNANQMSEMYDGGKIKRHQLGNPQWCLRGTIRNRVEE